MGVMSLFQAGSLFVRTQRGSTLRLLIALLLLAAIPLFVWAVLTQRIELRKKAATSEPPVVCWNRVSAEGNSFYWPNGCKGNPTPQMCTQATMPLSAVEKSAYEKWVKAHKPYIAGCGMPTPTPKPTCTPLPLCLRDNPPEKCALMGDVAPLPRDGRYCPEEPTPTPTCTPLPPCLRDNPPEKCALMGDVAPLPRGGRYCPEKPTPTPTPKPVACTMPPVCAYKPQPDGSCDYYAPDGVHGVPYCPIQCWNRVIRDEQGGSTENPRFTWPNGCKGNPKSEACTQVITNLTVEEIRQYAIWISQGKPMFPQCVNATPTPTPVTRQTVQFKVKLAGVDGAQAQSAKMSVKFYQKNGTTVQLSAPLTLTHLGNGVYRGSTVITNPLAANTQFRVKVKGEKHVAMEFCKQTGQTTRCQDGEYIKVPATVPTVYAFDFTGMLLLPGDLPPQNSVVDKNDLTRLTALMSKLCSNLTAAEKLTGDVDYSGCINVRDVFLVLQTLETRPDE